jgi:hypothetical protein
MGKKLPAKHSLMVEDDTSLPWKVATKKRGLQYHLQAVAFINTFPLGTIFSTKEFDGFIDKSKIYRVPFGSSPDSDAYKAYVYRRHNFMRSLIAAGTHPRMIDAGVSPFTVST